MLAIPNERNGGGPDVREKDGDVLSDAHAHADVYMLCYAFRLLPRRPMISFCCATGMGADPCLFFYCPQIPRPQIQAAA